ncbi:MAG TPA: tetratricopeptide repeat protein [Longimicrobiaceae bacterium]|nr:tetratricopeptide repeat protein [Longimicrobiaceae bacterium]
MSPVPARRAYGARLALWVVALFALGGGAVAVLLRVKPALNVAVFGSTGPRLRAGGAAEIRPAAFAGVREGRMGNLLLADLIASRTAPYAGWTTLGLDVAQSALLGRARQLAAAGQWAPALAAYDALLAAHPALEPVALERARLLAWSGDVAGSAAALASIAARRPGDAALRVEAARNYWWAARAEEADSLAGEALHIAPADTAAAALRARVRRQAQPSLATAQRWWRQNDGPVENLQLARALERERRYGASLRHFRAALRDGAAADSLPLEMASAALAADSLDAAGEGYTRWLRTHPRDRTVRLALAHSRLWAKDYAAAIPVYQELLADRDDPALRMELAQAQVWGGREAEAEGNLRSLVAADSTRPAAYRLLGDLARWRGDWAASADAYRRAQRLDPAQPGIALAVTEAEMHAAEAARGGLPLPTGEGRLAVEGFGDNLGFRRTLVRGTRHWETRWGTLDAAVDREVGSGTPPLSGAGADASGYGLSVRAGRAVGGGWTGSVEAGGRTYPGERSFATWGAALRRDDGAGRGTAIEYLRAPAFQRSATMAALHAGGVSDLLRASTSRGIAGGSAWTQVEAERLHAAAGTTGRLAATAALTRPLGGGWEAVGSIGAVTTRGDAPVLPDGQALWWTPAWYVEPEAGVGYRRKLSPAWTAGARATPGWAWVRERGAGLRRFPSTSFPTLGLGVDAAFRTGRWSATGAGSWDGSLGRGYRALGLSVGGAYALEVRR